MIAWARPLEGSAGVTETQNVQLPPADVSGRVDGAPRQPDDPLQAAIDSLGDGIVLYDQHDRLVTCNQSFRRLFPKIADAIVPGITFEALTRLGLERGQYREAIGREKEWLAERLAAHRNLHKPYELALDDGRWLRVIERRTPDGGTVGLRVDITELKRHELELAEKSALLEAALNSSLDAVIVADQRGRVITANANVASLFGYVPDEMLGRDLAELIVPQHHRERHRAGMDRFLTSGVSAILRQRVELDARRKDGTEIPVELTVVDARTPGRILFTAFVRDISARRAAAALKESYDRLAAIFDTNAAFVIALDSAGRIVRTNAPAAELLRTAAAGGDTERILAAARPAAIAAAPGDVPVPAKTFDTNITLSDGSVRHITWRSSPMRRHDDDEITVLVGIDVSAKRQAEAAMYQASKLVTLGEMATGLAHELNQPLAIIRLAVENIRASLTGMERSPDYFAGKVRRIEEQVARAAEIIDNMRIFGRAPKDAPEAFDVGSTVATALSLIRKQIEGAGIRLDCIPPTEPCVVVGRPTLLQQVVVNLALNARDAVLSRRENDALGTKTDDFIAVAVSSEPAAGAGNVVIEVADSGGGIPASLLSRIFEPFFTTKPAGKGTGLGLSISFGIVTEMNGRIEAANRGRGALFRIFLPRAG